MCGRGTLSPCTWPRTFLVQACQQLWVRYQGTTMACRTSRSLRRFTWVDPTTPSWFPTALLLAVAASAHACTASPKAEATLSRRLRTPPLPATHAALGNSWQNRRLCQSRRPHSSYVSDFVSHQRLVRPGLHYSSLDPFSRLRPGLR